MTSKIRLLPHDENGGKVTLWISSLSAISYHRQTSFTVSRFDAEMALESRHQTVGLVLKQFDLEFDWTTMVPYEKKAMSMSGLKVEQMALIVLESIKPSYLEHRYKSVRRRMKEVVDANRGHTKYLLCLQNVLCIYSWKNEP